MKRFYDCIETYLSVHNLSREYIEKQGCEISDLRGIISIPIHDETGNISFWKHRNFAPNTPKYTYDKGSTASLFNVHKIPSAQKVFIVEGEMDAMALQKYFIEQNKQDITVTSSTGGSKTWKKEWGQMLQGKQVFILYDTDEAGVAGTVKVWKELSLSEHNIDRIYILSLEKNTRELLEVKDVSDYLYATGKLGVLIWDTTTLGLAFLDALQSQKKTVKTKLLKGVIKLAQGGRSCGMSKIVEMITDVVKNEMPARGIKVSVKDTETLQDLKKIPITNFVDFKRNLAHCVFHSDKTPSMIYNDFDHSTLPNTVKCFSCGKFGTVIDVIMATRNVSFKEAVKILKENV